ncbi:unnamed protein product [Trifolium pratense]|uniref:Uncharacterized protein n=1 Tax=Trifolium pratense TaxID=57577 RepID=A0ACB0KS05_TRIPR|nr:unnamed protein product [Trifolium pratense]
MYLRYSLKIVGSFNSINNAIKLIMTTLNALTTWFTPRMNPFYFGRTNPIPIFLLNQSTVKHTPNVSHPLLVLST